MTPIMNKGTPKITKYGFKQIKNAIIINAFPISPFIDDYVQN